MKILQLHNAYLLKGGEEVVVERERDLLRSYGVEVTPYVVSNEDRLGEKAGVLDKIAVAARVPYSRDSKDKVAQAIRNERPDLVHVHNFFPLLTPSVFDACREESVPSVLTLHNYRILCANGLLFRDGGLCHECVHGSPYRGVLHGCYRGSRLASLPVARMISRHRKAGTWTTKIDRFIAMTEFAKAQFIQTGIPAERIVVKPHFLPDTRPFEGKPTPRAGALFVGRLSVEKGIATLVEAWRSLDVPLEVVGDGPLKPACEAAVSANFRLAGRLTSEQVLERMGHASFLVMPSVYYETFGLVLIEAFSQGLPVIASRLGAMREIVEEGVTGLLFEPGNASDLSAKVRWAASHAEEMGKMGETARKVFLEKYTPEVNYRALTGIYKDVIRRARHA